MTSTSPLDIEKVNDGLASVAAAAPVPLQHFTLDNGLSVYLREDLGTSLAAVQLWVHVGVSHEPVGHSNLSHLLEHLVFEGSSKLAAGQFSRVIARLGGSSDAVTLDDATAYQMMLPAARLPIALEIMADAMSTATFGQPEMGQGVKAVEDEYRLKFASNVREQAYNQHDMLAHGESAYATPSFGYPADLKNIKLETLRTWYRTWYHPNNATLVVVGNVALSTLRLHVSRYFTSLPRAPLAKPPIPRHGSVPYERKHTVALPALSNGVRMSFNVPSCATALDPTLAPTLELICDMLGKGDSSLLYSDLVRERRLISNVSVNYDPLVRGDTLLTITAAVNTSNATPEQAAEAIYQMIAELRLAPLSSEELERAKLRMLTRRLFSLDDLEGQATRIGAAAAAGLSPSVLDQEARIIGSLDSATVQSVALAYLGRERLTITYFQPGAAA